MPTTNPYRGLVYAEAVELAEERTTPENADEERELFAEAFAPGVFPITAKTIPSEDGAVSVWERCTEDETFAKAFVKERGIEEAGAHRGRFGNSFAQQGHWTDQPDVTHEEILDRIREALSIPAPAPA